MSAAVTAVRGRRTMCVLAGVGVVGLSAAVPSLAGLTGLAADTGWSQWLAPLLPVSIDAAGIVASLVWLDPDMRAPVRTYARTVVMAALAASIAGNAGDHALTALHITAPLWLVLAVAAVPPIALAATAHLAALILHTPAVDTAEDVDVESSQAHDVRTSRAHDVGPFVDRSAPAIEADPSSSIAGAARSTQVTEPIEKPAEISTPRRTRSIADLQLELDTAIENPHIDIDPRSAESIRRTLACSPKRARELRDSRARELTSSIVKEGKAA